MKMKKVTATLLTTALAATTVLASGCGSDGGNSDSAKKELDVFIFADDATKQVYQGMIDKYLEEHSDTIESINLQTTPKDEYVTTLKGMMQSGKLPDVLYMEPNSVADYVNNGYLASLTELMKDSDMSTEGIYENVLDFYRYDSETKTQGEGDLYALPKDFSVFGYAYNQDIFDEAGLDYPDPENPYTYEEFVEVCQELTKDTDGDGEIDQWGCGFADTLMLYAFIWSNEASFLSDDYKTVTIDTDEFKDAVQKYVDLTLKYKVTPTVDQDTSLGVYQRWIAGQEAFYGCGTWEISAMNDDATFAYDYNLCGYPTLSSGVSYTYLGSVGFCIAESSENKQEALDLIYYLTTDMDGQKIVSGLDGDNSVQLPITKDFAENDFVEAVENGDVTYPSNVEVYINYMNGTDKYQGKMPEYMYTPNSEWLTPFWDGLTTVKRGDITVDEFIDDVKDEMQQYLDTAWENAA